MDTMEAIEIGKLIAEIGLSGFLAIVLLTTIRGANRNQAMLITLFEHATASIQASTTAIVDLKRCEDETQTIVSGLRREVTLVHGTQLESLKAIQDALAPLPSMAAAVGRIEPNLAEVRSLVEGARDAAVGSALTLSSILNKLDSVQARPITPARGVEGSAERVRIEQQAREQIAQMDARKTGEASAVAANERTTDEQRSE